MQQDRKAKLLYSDICTGRAHTSSDYTIRQLLYAIKKRQVKTNL